MTQTLISRLREKKRFGTSDGLRWYMIHGEDADCVEAADEIERLRGAAACGARDGAEDAAMLPGVRIRVERGATHCPRSDNGKGADMTPDESLLALPEPDVWIPDRYHGDAYAHSAAQMRAYALAHRLAERERRAKLVETMDTTGHHDDIETTGDLSAPSASPQR